MNQLALQNPFLDIAYGTTPAVANAALADLRCGMVRLGSGNADGGAAVWNHVDTTSPSGPYYPVQRSHDNIERAVAQGIPVVLVNVSPYRTTDLAGDGGETTIPRYPVDEAAYLAWLQTSVAPLAHRTDCEVVFQIHNEPMNAEFWADTHGNYAQLLVKSANVLHQYGRTGQRVAAAGMTPTYLRSVAADILTQTSNALSVYADVIDFHLFGYADQIAQAGGLYPYAAILDQIAAYRAGLPTRGIPFWVTETATYSGDGTAPVYLNPSPPPDTLPYPVQTETQQARESVKRMLYALACGAEYAEWAYLPDTAEPTPPANTYFNHTGLRGVSPFTKKLAYWSLRECASVLARCTTPLALGAAVDADSTNVQVLTATDTAGAGVQIVWWDWYLDSAPGATVDVTLAVDATARQVSVTPLVSAAASGAVAADADFDPTYTACQDGRVTLTLGHTPVAVEVTRTTPATFALLSGTGTGGGGGHWRGAGR